MSKNIRYPVSKALSLSLLRPARAGLAAFEARLAHLGVLRAAHGRRGGGVVGGGCGGSSSGGGSGSGSGSSVAVGHRRTPPPLPLPLPRRPSTGAPAAGKPPPRRRRRRRRWACRRVLPRVEVGAALAVPASRIRPAQRSEAAPTRTIPTTARREAFGFSGFRMEVGFLRHQLDARALLARVRAGAGDMAQCWKWKRVLSCCNADRGNGPRGAFWFSCSVVVGCALYSRLSAGCFRFQEPGSLAITRIQ